MIVLDILAIGIILLFCVSSIVVSYGKQQDKYNKKITNKTFIHKNIITRKGQDLIISKGRGA